MLRNKTIALSPSTSLNVTISGTASIEPALIFLHFWGGSCRTFSQVTNKLSPHFRCIAIEFPGWGSSTGPQDSDAYTVSSLAQTFETLFPHLDVQEFILIGHSMGRKVAQLIAGRGLVEGLKPIVLIAPAPPTPLQLSEDMKKQQLAAYHCRESAEYVTRNTVAMLVEDMMEGNEFAKAAWPAYGMGEDILEETRKIDLPVLVIAGELDKVETVQRFKREVVENVRGAERVVIERKGHLLPVEAALEISKAVEMFASGLLTDS